VGVRELLPGIGLRRLERQADPLLVEVDVEDLHVTSSPTATTDDGWSTCFQDSSETCTSPSMPPRSTKAPKLTTEDTTPLRISPGFRLTRKFAALLALGLLEPCPPRQHDVVAVLVELDDLRLECLADVGLQVAHPAQLDERRRKEAAQADVDDEAALHDLDDRAAYDAAGLLDLLDRAPGPLVLRALLRQDEAALFVLLLENERLDLLADRDDLMRVDVVADRELASGDHALGLEADVQQHLVLVDLHDRAGDDVAVLEGDDGLVDRVLEGEVAEIVLDDLAGDVDPVGVEGASKSPAGSGPGSLPAAQLSPTATCTARGTRRSKACSMVVTVKEMASSRSSSTASSRISS
jgi:hypothetical protein